MFKDRTLTVWQPYKLGVWLSQNVSQHCLLCYTQPSALINNPFSSKQFHSKQPSFFSKYLFKYIDTGILCQHCHDSIHWLPKPFGIEIMNGELLIIQQASYYQYPVDEVIKQFKFSENMLMLPILVYFIHQLPVPKGLTASNTVILPMPTTVDRIRSRGFDPVNLLAPYLSQHWQIPLWHGVDRVDSTVSQRGLSRNERLHNLDGAFAVTENIPCSNIILFDDVATTGASLRSLANAIMLEKNNLHLSAYCLAHGSAFYEQ